ncbi:MAG: CHAT domain-containing protein, partial [Acidobacteriota bacterium]
TLSAREHVGEGEFSFFPHSEADKAVLMGDARLVMEANPSPQYDVLVNVLIALHRQEEALLASEEARGRPFLDLVRSVSPVDGEPAVGHLVSADAALPRAGETLRGGAAIPGAMEPTMRSEAHNFTLTAADIRRTVEQQGATLISYWLSMEHLTIWVMKPGQAVVAKQVKVNHDVVGNLVVSTLQVAPGGRRRGAAPVAQVRTRGGVSQAVQRAKPKAWRELYELLIAPIEAELPKDAGSRVIVVPEDALHLLSFAALMDAEGHYLVERYALSTTPAIGILQLTAANEVEAAKLAAKYVVLANPGQMPRVRGRELPALPGTDAEAHGIVRVLPGRSSTLLLGREAGIDSLGRQLGSATVLHFATHAIVSDGAPMSSFLALDRRQRGGELTAASVYGMKMHTSLVVLSACSTGRGRFSNDGVAGLGRAFFYAGAASLVTTLWDVVDQPTAQLMPTFYAGLAKGESRSAALREAQLGLIRDLRAHKVKVETLAGTNVSLPENPAYWAAFSLSGQP